MASWDVTHQSRLHVSMSAGPWPPWCLPGPAAHSEVLDLDAETSDCADVAVPTPVAPTTREPERQRFMCGD